MLKIFKAFLFKSIKKRIWYKTGLLWGLYGEKSHIMKAGNCETLDNIMSAKALIIL